MTAWPWGTGPAPALLCDECRKRIGKQRSHLVTESGHLLCIRCLSDPKAHAKYHPNCPKGWHDMHDHGLKFATRASAWFALDNPEKRRCP